MDLFGSVSCHIIAWACLVAQLEEVCSFGCNSITGKYRLKAMTPSLVRSGPCLCMLDGLFLYSQPSRTHPDEALPHGLKSEQYSPECSLWRTCRSHAIVCWVPESHMSTTEAINAMISALLWMVSTTVLIARRYPRSHPPPPHHHSEFSSHSPGKILHSRLSLPPRTSRSRFPWAFSPLRSPCLGCWYTLSGGTVLRLASGRGSGPPISAATIRCWCPRCCYHCRRGAGKQRGR